MESHVSLKITPLQLIVRFVGNQGTVQHMLEVHRIKWKMIKGG